LIAIAAASSTAKLKTVMNESTSALPYCLVSFATSWFVRSAPTSAVSAFAVEKFVGPPPAVTNEIVACRSGDAV